MKTSCFIPYHLIRLMPAILMVASAYDQPQLRGNDYSQQRRRLVGNHLSYGQPTNAQVRITEITYNPAVCGNSVGEWIELHNAGSVSTNFGGWILQDNIGSVTLPSVELPPGGYYMLALCGDVDAKEIANLSLTNSGNTVTLLDDTGAMIDSQPYPSREDSPERSIARRAEASGKAHRVYGMIQRRVRSGQMKTKNASTAYQ